MFIISFCVFIFFIFSQSFADSCNPQNLKLDSLTEFYTCKTDQRVDYLKNYSSIREWNEDSVCNLCLEKIRPKKINKISIKNENQLKKKDEVKGSNTEVVRKAFKNVKNPEIKRLRNEKITKKITEKPPNITENQVKAGLDMFDEEASEISMKCWDSHQGNWLTFEKVGDTIWRRLNDGARAAPAKIIEADEKAKRYYAPLDSIVGKIDVVLDFKKKTWEQKSAIGGSERYSCM